MFDIFELFRPTSIPSGVANQLAMLAKPCTVTIGHLKQSGLKLGDGPDQNAIPPGVIAAFGIIVDK